MAFYLPLGWVNIFRNALQGMGEAFVPLMGGVMELIMRVVVATIAVRSASGLCALQAPWPGSARISR